MTRLNEEKDDTAVIVNAVIGDPLKQHSRSCNERSDSGFSECSNCSTPAANCMCTSTSVDRTEPITEEPSVPIEPEVATDSQHEDVERKSESNEASHTSCLQVEEDEVPLDFEVPEKSTSDSEDILVVTAELPREHEDLHVEPRNVLNSVKTRKFSLEKSSRESTPSSKHEVSLSNLKKSSKVALLAEKFETSNCSSLRGFRTKSTVTNFDTKGLAH